MRDDALQRNHGDLLRRARSVFECHFLEIPFRAHPYRGDICSPLEPDERCEKQKVDEHARADGKKEHDDGTAGLFHWTSEYAASISESASSGDFRLPATAPLPL